MVGGLVAACISRQSLGSPRSRASAVPHDPGRSPEQICGGHLTKQRADLVGRGWTTRSVPTLPRPEQAEPASVPGEHSVRLDDVNGRAPTAPRPREPGPQHSVGRREAKTRASRSIYDGQLVSERNNLQVQRSARADHEPERVEQGEEDGRHDLRLSKNAYNLNRRNGTVFSVATGGNCPHDCP